MMLRYLKEEQNVELYTPVKKRKGQKFLSPQNASKVRSYQGLMVHVFGKFADAMFLKSEM